MRTLANSLLQESFTEFEVFANGASERGDYLRRNTFHNMKVVPENAVEHLDADNGNSIFLDLYSGKHVPNLYSLENRKQNTGKRNTKFQKWGGGG